MNKQKEASPRQPITYTKAFGIIIPLCLVALLLAGGILSVANDVYAFVKPDKTVTVALDGQIDAKSFSLLLQSDGIINNAFVFEMYLRSRGLENKLAELDGELILNSQMSYRELIDEIF